MKLFAKLRRQVDRGNDAVGADTDMIFSANLQGVLDMPDHIVGHLLPIGP